MPQNAGNAGSSYKFSQTNLFSHLPDEILAQPRFLLWREILDPPSKPRKVPYYANGSPRFGTLDTEVDLGKLVSFKEAISVFESSDIYRGIGFAVCGEGIGAFDIDECLDLVTGELMPDHAGYETVQRLAEDGAYIEISPSGTGLRILGPTEMRDPYSRDKVEYWAEKRFVTLTGALYKNSKGWKPLTERRKALKFFDISRDTGADAKSEHLVTPKTIRELESALGSINPDNRELWIRIGMALRSLEHRGWHLWSIWSAGSEKFNLEDAKRVWDSFRPETIDFRAVFKEAQDNWGWENPRSKSKLDNRLSDSETDKDAGPAVQFIELSETPKPIEYTLDGFVPNALSVFAAPWGIGKTSNILPLALVVAGILKSEGITAELRRKVVWVSEDPAQVERILISLMRGSVDRFSTLREWFHLAQAAPRSYRALRSFLEGVCERFEYPDSKGYLVKPLVVFDTLSANFELINENDNAEVKTIVSHLKYAGAPPVWVIGHTPKAMVRADVDDMTFRGAGAWEADANATFFLFHDEAINKRVLAIRKSRFSPVYNEIHFGTGGHDEIIDVPWDGNPQLVKYVHGVAEIGSREDRQEARQELREQEREERQEQREADRLQEILTLVRESTAAGELLSRRGVFERIGGRRTDTFRRINALVETGQLKVVEPPPGVVDHRVREVVLPAEVDGTATLERARIQAPSGPETQG
jgi:hypothetical protein